MSGRLRRCTVGLAICAIVGMTAMACGGEQALDSPPTRIGHPAGSASGIAVGDVVIGRAAAGARVWLLTLARNLIAIDIERGVAAQVAVRGVPPVDNLWGLARLDDGALWTLVGRHGLGQLMEDGRLVRRIDLRTPHLGLFASGGDLLYQVFEVDPPAPALTAGPPGESNRRAWGVLHTRVFDRPRAETMALNLVSCGLGERGLLPCWLPGQASIALTDQNGAGRVTQLAGVAPQAPDEILMSSSPARSVRDVYALHNGDVWVLSSTVADAAAVSPGAAYELRWWLKRFSPAGQLREVVTVPEPARLILGRSGRSLVLLTAAGTVLVVDI